MSNVDWSSPSDAALLVEEQVEDRAPRRIGERPEHRVIHAMLDLR